ncbi:MAG: C40 family peptidase [Bacteroides sp.]|nr:C40 family peptidase [Bacteroides sp.]
MEYAICFLPVIPVRRTPEDGGELMTELLFGDACEVHEYMDSWARIHNKAYDYEGWLTTKMLTFISREEYEAYDPAILPVVSFYYAEAFHTEKNEHLLLAGGSVLPDYRPDGTFRVKDNRYRIDPEVVKPVTESIVETAMKYYHSPYLWGGKNPMGIDCSGLTQVVYRIHGIQIPRNACVQAEIGELVPFIQEAMPGDLAFFDHGDGKISHVGIVLENGYILHASGEVRIDKLDAQGIYKEEIRTYTHDLRFIKRISSSFPTNS